MEQQRQQLNEFLVGAFNEILKTEETCLSTGPCQGLSIREIHIIEEVCAAQGSDKGNRAAAIAKSQRITAGTLTTAVALLEKKGYLERCQDSRDKRVVRILPTQKGLAANALHQEFHREMVREITQILSPQEVQVLIRGLDGIQSFFREKYSQGKG